MMRAITSIEGTAAVLAINNIDTDQIIPAEYLKTTNKKGLGKHLFQHWRYQENGEDNPGFVLNQPATRNSKILIAGDNFGCGSSREHAPWALLDYGIQVVISSSIADIFRNNSLKNGLLPIVVSNKELAELAQCSGQAIKVDIKSLSIKAGERHIDFEMDAFARYCFIKGMDELDYLLSQMPLVEKFEQQQVRYAS